MLLYDFDKVDYRSAGEIRPFPFVTRYAWFYLGAASAAIEMIDASVLLLILQLIVSALLGRGGFEDSDKVYNSDLLVNEKAFCIFELGLLIVTNYLFVSPREHAADRLDQKVDLIMITCKAVSLEPGIFLGQSFTRL
jgi:hypothetical protein